MENPDSGVVGDNTEGDTFARGDLDGVTTDRVHQALVDRRVECGVVRGVVRRPLDDLELVSVQVARRLCQYGDQVKKHDSARTRGAFRRHRS